MIEPSRFREPPAVLLGLGDALRELQALMLRIPAEEGAGADVLRIATEHVRAATKTLASSGLAAETDATLEPERRPRYSFGPMVGPHVPTFPVPHVEHTNGATHGHVHFDLPFEGPPGSVHGGFVALFFDQVLGQHNMAVEASGMTARLTVDYRRPTPLGHPLRFEVEGGRTDPRKTLTRGQLSDEHGTVAEAEGLFVVPRGGMPGR